MLKRKNNKVLYIGISILCVGILIGVIPKQIERKNKIEENKKIEEYIEITSNEMINNIQVEESYIMVLEIPKINLKKGIYAKDSEENTIEKNVQIMAKSHYPSDLNGNVILEAHNGNSSISFFRDIDQLEVNDSAYIYYQGIKYHYILKTKYEVEKDGEVEIKRSPNQSTLTLITCKKNTVSYQIVIILYLDGQEKY